jgi:CheY-like chemotaxis protein
VDVLMIDDSVADARLMAEAMRTVAPDTRLVVVQNGDAAMARLKDREAPRLVLLDLNLAGESGHAVLARIKSDPMTRLVPVIVFSSSDDDKDVASAYEGHASCYVTKPRTLNDLYAFGEALTRFWLRCATLPRRALEAS